MYSGIQPEKRLEQMFLMYRVSVEVGANIPGKSDTFSPGLLGLGDPMGAGYSGYSRSNSTNSMGMSLGKSNHSISPYMMKGAGNSNSALSAYGLSGSENSYTTASAQYSGGKGGSGTGSSSAGGGK